MMAGMHVPSLGQGHESQPVINGRVSASWSNPWLGEYYSTAPVRQYHGSTHNMENGKQALLEFTPYSVVDARLEHPFTLGKLRVVNGRTVSGTELRNAFLSVKLGLPGAEEGAPITLLFRLVSTPDTGDPLVSADTVDLVPVSFPDSLVGGRAMKWSLSWSVVSGGGRLQGDKLFVNEDSEVELEVCLTLRPSNLSVGNLVFVDKNANGRADAGEGVRRVKVQLFREGDSPGVSQPLDETRTTSSGSYRLNVMEPGRYFVHVPPSEFTVGGVLAGMESLPDGRMYAGMTGGETLARGANEVPFVHYTRQPKMMQNGILSQIAGLDIRGPVMIHGQSVRSFAEFGSTLPYFLQSRSTLVHLGRHQVTEGSVYGKDLSGANRLALSHVPTPLGVGLLHVVRNEQRPKQSLWHLQDRAAARGVPTLTLSSTSVFGGESDAVRVVHHSPVNNLPPELYPPGWPSGYAHPWVVVYIRADHLLLPHVRVTAPVHQIVVLGQADEPSRLRAASLPPRSILVVQDGSVPLPRNVFFTGQNSRPLIFGCRSGGARQVDFRFTAPSAVPEVSWRLHLYAENTEISFGARRDAMTILRGTLRTNASPYVFLAASTLASAFSIEPVASVEPELAEMMPVDSWLERDFSTTAIAGDDDRGEDGIDDPTPGVKGISTIVFQVGERSEPVDATTETGFDSSADNEEDEASDLTIDFGFSSPLFVESNVFADRNRNGRSDANEAQGGTRVQLFRAGDDPSAVEPLDEACTDAEGKVRFLGLAEGSYFLRVPEVEFRQGGTLGFHRVLGAGQDAIPVPYPDVSGAASAAFMLSAAGQLSKQLKLGFAPPRLAVGNVVFIDRNLSGGCNAGEGVSGVRMELYRPQAGGPPTRLATAFTDAQGQYLFDELEPGAYFLSVAADNFTETGPLANMVSMPGTRVSDDDEGEDGVDARNTRSGGEVGCHVFELMPDAAPIGESGQASSINGFWDSDVDLTRDFGFVEETLRVQTFDEWRSLHSAVTGGRSGPTEDHDGDGYDNLLEYALTNTVGSTSGPILPIWTKNIEGHYNFVYETGSRVPRDVRYTVEINQTLDGTSPWKPVSAPRYEVPDHYAGSGVVRYGNLNLDSSLRGSSFQFARLRVSLDANLDGTADAEAVTPVHAIQNRVLTADNLSLAVPLVGASAYSGRGGILASDTLSFGGVVSWAFHHGAEYYVEVADGVLAGHRFEVLEGQSSGSGLKLHLEHPRNTTKPTAALNGALLHIRRHYRIEDLFPAERHLGGTRVTTSANISYHQPGGGWRTLWLWARNGERRWLDSSDASFTERGGEPVAPGEAVFVRTRSALMAWDITGWVRSTPFRMALNAGNNFVASPWPSDSSPDALLLTAANGFMAARRSRDAARLLLWNADARPGVAGYETYYLFQMGNDARWVNMADATLESMNACTLLKGGNGFFLHVPTAHAGWLIPPPMVR